MLSPELLRIQPVLQAFLAVVAGVLSMSIHYLVLDGHFGNYPSTWMVLQSGLQFVSKLRWDAALYEPFMGKYRGRGPHLAPRVRLSSTMIFFQQRYPDNPILIHRFYKHCE